MADPDGPMLVRRIGLLAGPILGALVYVLLPAESSGGLAHSGRATAAVGVLMATWWLTEALPLEATSLLPLLFFPLTKAGTMKGAAAPYADPIIFLFMGGLILGRAMERCNLHKRIALIVLSNVGGRPAMLLGGVMGATALISAFVSNTATAVMMLPIAASIVAMLTDERGEARAGRDFATAIVLAVAYASSIGGVATLIGTPPNAFLAGFVKGRPDLEPITFASWLRVGIPCALVYLPIAWLILIRVAFRVPTTPMPGVRDQMRQHLRALGPVSRAEWVVLIVFCGTAALWVTRPWLGRWTGLIIDHPGGPTDEYLTDTGIAIAATLALFILPGNGRERAMDWRTAVQLPWGVLLLFGGGLALAQGVSANGVDAFLGRSLTGLDLHPFLVVAIVTTFMVFITEIASNTAVASTFIPILYAGAPALGVDPMFLLYPAAIGASYAFMLPMGTPPNALVFASGYVRIRQMAHAGLFLNIAAILVIVLLCYFLGPTLGITSAR